MLLLTRPAQGPRWSARFVSRARFVCCDGLQDPDAGRRLSAAFSSHWDQVKSFRIDDARDDTCWYAGDGWWLSTATVDTETVT
jgi:protein-L-isoaspartate(D-aspartate) O-methyltransferase